MSNPNETKTTEPVSPDPADVQAVAEMRVAAELGRPLTDAQLRRALEAYKRACAAEYRRQHPDGIGA